LTASPARAVVKGGTSSEVVSCSSPLSGSDGSARVGRRRPLDNGLLSQDADSKGESPEANGAHLHSERSLENDGLNYSLRRGYAETNLRRYSSVSRPSTVDSETNGAGHPDRNYDLNGESVLSFPTVPYSVFDAKPSDSPSKTRRARAVSDADHEHGRTYALGWQNARHQADSQTKTHEEKRRRSSRLSAPNAQGDGGRESPNSSASPSKASASSASAGPSHPRAGEASTTRTSSKKATTVPHDDGPSHSAKRAMEASSRRQSQTANSMSSSSRSVEASFTMDAADAPAEKRSLLGMHSFSEPQLAASSQRPLVGVEEGPLQSAPPSLPFTPSQPAALSSSADQSLNGLLTVSKPVAGSRRGSGNRELSLPSTAGAHGSQGRSPLGMAGRSMLTSASEPQLPPARMQRAEKFFKDVKLARGSSMAMLPQVAKTMAPAQTEDKDLSLGPPQQPCVRLTVGLKEIRHCETCQRLIFHSTQLERFRQGTACTECE